MAGIYEGVDGVTLIATVVSSTESTLVVITPQGVKTVPVAVKVADDTSNDLPFEVNTVEVQLDFGDKGSDNGDTFALFMELNYDAAKSPLEGSLAIARNLAMMNAWVMPS